MIEKERIEALKVNIEPVFCFALAWGIAGACDSESRAKFDAWLKTKKNLPAKNTVFEQLYDVHEMKWRGWLDTVVVNAVDAKRQFSDLVVQTPDSIGYAFMMQHIMTQLKHGAKPQTLNPTP